MKNIFGQTRMILEGDCLVQLKAFPDNYFHAVVTDPPYGLAFMGKKWDYDVPSIDVWKEILRVLRPGGHVLSFGGTRTYHRMVVNIEDAGFEIRDQLQWIYGSGFPKSHDVSKGIDKAAGAEREILSTKREHDIRRKKGGGDTKLMTSGGDRESVEVSVTAPATDDAKTWEGWGTALKPANEPIVLARKPLEKGLTVAQNVLKWGTGALNIDAGRIEGAKRDPGFVNGRPGSKTFGQIAKGDDGICDTQGRWPANVLFDEAAAEVLDAQSGITKSGGASRFFYVAKASKRERNAGLEGMPEKRTKAYEGGDIASAKTPDSPGGKRTAQNFHPTVKPVALMEYLIKLVTPETGIVLDPFCGSGTTGVAAFRNGFGFIGIEREKEYCAIAEKRIEATA